ncbi:hypothetical protein CDAR_84221 [Caerostris darwini]|uniref:Ycf15 n=1 Tax=Caerostris darwini TaxID=1538125 RepID=A0AAV4U675_9ARAC|nr:hypothetical protein CDAR_84221 [Caerostris darwini]
MEKRKTNSNAAKTTWIFPARSRTSSNSYPNTCGSSAFNKPMQLLSKIASSTKEGRALQNHFHSPNAFIFIARLVRKH